MHERFAAALDRVARRDRADPGGGARRRRARAAALADAHPPDAEGLDGPARGRRRPDRGNVALAPGAARRRARERRPAPRGSRTGCAATGPEELFDDEGRLLPELAAQAPEGDRRMSANPHANGGELLRDLVLPDFRDYAVEVDDARDDVQRGDARARRLPPRRRSPATATTSASSAPTRRRRTGSATSSRSPTAPGSRRRSASTTISRRTAA